MKAGFWTSWILENRILRLSSCKQVISFQKKGVGWGEVTPQVIQKSAGLPLPPQVWEWAKPSPPRFQSLGPPHCFQEVRPLPRARGNDATQMGPEGGCVTPVDTEDRALHQRRLFSSFKILWHLPCQVLDLLELVTPLSSLLPLGMGMLILCRCYCWKQMTSSVSQIHRWRGFLSPDKAFLEFHPPLI